MDNKNDREFEELLRHLPTAEPGEGVRRRVLGGAKETARSRRRWKAGLAWAFCLLALILVDLGIQEKQEDCLSGLIYGEERLAAPMRAGDNSMMMAYLQGRVTIDELLREQETR